MLRFPLPVIAAVNGAAVGLGCSLAVLCDIVLISETAYLADPHVSVGLVAGDGGAAFWPLLTPILRSREYLYTGDRIPAATAVELGLATRATPPEELLPEARRLAERLAAQPAEALRGTKRVANMHLSQALSGAMQAGFAAERVTMRTAEHRAAAAGPAPARADDASADRRPRTSSEFRASVRDWCRAHVPPDWRQAQTGRVRRRSTSRFQQWWFGELRAGRVTRCRTGRPSGAAGCPSAEQVVLYSELAAHDAPRLVLAFVAIHHAAATLLAAGTDEQRRTAPARPSWTARSGSRASPSPRPGPTWPACGRPPAGTGDRYVVNGQKLWASGATHADWCLLLARTDPDAPKRRGISYFLLDMRTPGIDVRPIRQATGESHFCEIFLTDVEIPAAKLVGPENGGWQVAQETLGAERGMTMLELAERLGNAGFRWLVEACARRPAALPDDSLVADRLAAFETEITGAAGAVPRPGRAPRQRGGRPGRRLDREAVLQRAAAADDGLRRRGRRAARARGAAQARLQRLGVRRLGAGLHRLVGVDDPRRDERDPAHDHRRARPRPAERSCGMSDVARLRRGPRRAAGGRPRPALQGPVRARLGRARRVRLARPGGAGRPRRRGRDLRRDRRHPARDGPGRGHVRPYLGAAVLGVGHAAGPGARPRTGTSCCARPRGRARPSRSRCRQDDRGHVRSGWTADGGCPVRAEFIARRGRGDPAAAGRPRAAAATLVIVGARSRDAGLGVRAAAGRRRDPAARHRDGATRSRCPRGPVWRFAGDPQCRRARCSTGPPSRSRATAWG